MIYTTLIWENSCINVCITYSLLVLIPVFTLTSNIHAYYTRSSARGNLFVQFNRRSMSKNSVVHRGISYWNSLDDFLNPAHRQRGFSCSVPRTYCCKQYVWFEYSCNSTRLKYNPYPRSGPSSIHLSLF